MGYFSKDTINTVQSILYWEVLDVILNTESRFLHLYICALVLSLDNSEEL